MTMNETTDRRRPNKAQQKIAELGKLAAERSKEKGVQLPLWAEERRGVPNEVVRCALFTVRNARTKRDHYKGVYLYSLGGAEVFYQGEELRTDDEDVWLQILHMAKEKPLGEPIEFKPAALLKSLGWATSSHYYNKLKEILNRMQATAVNFVSERLNNMPGTEGDSGVSLSLIRRFDWKGTEWRVWIEPEMRQLFGDNHYTQLEWEKRMKLGAIAKRLYDYFSSHKRNYPVKIDSLQQLCGSKSSPKEFRRSFRKSMNELMDCGCIIDWSIEDNGLVQVKRPGRE